MRGKQTQTNQSAFEQSAQITYLVLRGAVRLVRLGVLGTAPCDVRVARGQTQQVVAGAQRTDGRAHVQWDQLHENNSQMHLVVALSLTITPTQHTHITHSFLQCCSHAKHIRMCARQKICGYATRTALHRPNSAQYRTPLGRRGAATVVYLQPDASSRWPMSFPAC